MSYIPDTSFETKTVLSGSYSSEIVNISTADDYYTLMNSTDPTVLNKQYKLLQDIEISNVKSIGTLANPFTGGFDGNNKKITIVSLDSTTNTSFRGIIGVIGGNTNYIKNINLVINDVTNMRITTPDSWIECGCIAGSSLSSSLIIDNCSVLLNNLYINPYSANFGTRAGIIIGYGLNTTISNCNVEWKLYGGFFANSMYTSLTTLSKYASTGIIMGEGINCTINNINIIIPSFEVVGITFFGYICGRIKNSSISNCNIVANFGARYISYFGILGSLVGVLVSTNVSNFKLITSNLSMITSDGTGEISSYKLVAGGLIGYLAENAGKTITNCFVISRYDQGSTIRGYYSSQFITMSDENIGTIQNCFLYIPSITTVTVSGSQYNIYSLSAAIQAISGSSNSNNIRVFVTSEIDAVSTIIQGINTVTNKTLDIYYYLKAFYYTGYAQIVNLLKQADGTSYSTFIINAANGIVQARGEAFITVPVTYADIKGLLSNNLAESEYKDSDTLPIHYSVINNSNRVYIQNGPTAETVMQNTILPYSSISKLYFPGDYEKAIEISENGITYNGTTYGVGDIIYIRNNEYSNYEYITIKGLGKGIAYVYYGIQDKIGIITNNFDVYNIRRLITTQLSLNPVNDIVEIHTLADLKTLLWSNDPVILNKNYKLMADITVTNAYDFQSIGNTYYPFTGSFDGNGYTITNNVTTKHFALFNVIGGDRSSLSDTDNRKYIKNIKYIVNGCSYHNYIVENENIIFGTLINSCQAKSIIIENCNVYMKGYYTLRLDKINRCVVGMLIGYTNEAKVQNCNVFCERNELSFNKNKTPVYINVFGSLIGYSNASIIQNNNVVYRTITINPYYVLSYLTVTGGLIGYSRNDTITNCLHYNTEYLTIQYVHTNGYYGGIIGYLEGTTISNCYYVGESRIYGFDSGKTNPNEIIGGVFGYINKNTVTNTNFNIQKCLAFYYKGLTDVRWCNTLSIVIGESPNISGSTIQDCYSIFRYPIETNTVPNIYSKTSSNNLTFNTRVSSNVITNNTATDNTVISTFLTNLQLESNITYAWLILYINQTFGVATTTDFTLQILNNINTQNSIVTKNIVFEQVKAKPNGIISTTYSNIKSSLSYKESSEDIDTTQVRLVTSDYTSFEPYRTYLILTKTDNNTITITINGNTTTITTNGNKIIKNGTEYNIGDIIPGPPTIKAKGIGSLYVYTAIPNTITTQVPVTNNNIIPADDGLQLWLDASDSQNIVSTTNRTVGLESYPIVDAWLDKSGKNNHAVVAVDRSSPIYINTSKYENLYIDYVPNLNAFTGAFTEGGLLDSKNAILVRGYETGTIDTLISQLSVSNNLGFFALVKKIGDGSIFGSPYNSNMQISSGLLYGSFTASDNSYINVTVADNNSTNIISTNNVDSATLIEHYTTTNNTFVTKINGTQVGTPATLYSNTINFINGLAFTGKYSNNATASSLIFEVLIYNRILTTEEIQKIEGHILWKWGLQSKLPSDHPYKSAAPTAPAPEEPDPAYNFGPLSQNGMALWLDSNDTQTLVFDTNKRQIGNAQYDVVIKWKDKSGNKKHAVPNSINSAPIYLPQVTYNFVTSADDTYMPGVGYYNSNNSLLSNRPTLAFRGREYGGAQTTPSKVDKLIAPIEVNNYMSFFAVVKKFTDGCIFGSGNLDGGSTYPNMVITYSYDYGTISDINGNALGSGLVSSYQGVHFTNPTLIEHYNYAESVDSNGYFRTKINASSTDVFNKTISSTTQFISNLQMVGRNDEIASAFIKEVIIYNRQLTTQEIQTIEGYLMWKWGINSLMPVTHPYYASPPTPTTYDFSSISIPTEPQAPSTTINYYTILNEGTLNGKMYFWLDADDATRMYTPYSRTIPGSSLSYQVITKLFDKSGKNNHASIHGTSTGPIYLSSIVQDFVNAATNTYSPGLNAFTIIKNKPALFFRHTAYNDFDSLIAKWPTERVFNEDLGEEQDAQRFFCAFIVFQKVKDGAPLFSLTDYTNNYSGYPISGGDIYGKIGDYGDDWTNGLVTINEDSYNSNPTMLEYFISEDTAISTETQKYYKYIRRLNGGVFESILPQGQAFDLFKNGIKINESDNVLMHEILIYNTPMTQVQVEKIEGYLAHKWNINSLLPSSHIYKAQSPLGGSGSGGGSGGGGGPITESFDGTGTGVGPSLTIAIDNTATTIASFKVTADITSAGATAASKIKVYGFVWKAITDSTDLKYNLLPNSRTLVQVAADITYNFAISPDFEKTVTGLESNTSYTIAAYAINSDNVITYTTPLIITTLGECPTAPIEPPAVNYDNLTIQGTQPVAITNDDKIVTLFKKFQGYPNTSKNIGLNAEYAANALPLTFPSQVATQVVPSLGIPSTSKIDNGEPDTLVFTSELFAGGGRHVWNANCHIAYYSKIVLTPTTQNPGQCFYIYSKQKNFLTNTLLPTMSNDENKYNITVEKNIGTRQSPNWVILQPDYYVIDKDVGLLTIYETNSVINGINPPRISFWRYEGLTLNTPGAILGGDIPSGALLFKDSTGKVSGTNSFQVILDQLKTEFRVQGQMTVTGVVDPLGVTFDPTSKNPMDPTDPLYDTCLWYSRENSKFYFGDKILFMYDDIPENENYSGPTGPTGFTGIQGTQGAQGFTGSNGLQGVQGFTGPTGQRGIDGIAGSQGFTGTQGAQGFTGPMGPPGPAGSGGGGSLGDIAGTDIYLNIQSASGSIPVNSTVRLFESATDLITPEGISYDISGNITYSESGLYELNIIMDANFRQSSGIPVVVFNIYINNMLYKSYNKNVGTGTNILNSSTVQLVTIIDLNKNDTMYITVSVGSTIISANYYTPTLLIKRISKIQGPTGPAGSGGGGNGAQGAQGFTGPTGSTVGVNELYIQPAAPTNPTNTTSSIQININWVNPPQKQLSFLPIKVPFIKDIHITLEDASTPSNLITIYDSAIEDPYISTLVISNQTGTSQKSAQTYTWYKNATNITGPFKVTIWYTNYSSDNPNKLIVENLAFAIGGAPSVPITVTINTSDIQSNQALVTVTPGQYTDALLQNNLPTITSYNFIYKALSSSRRGGLAVAATDLTTTSATTTKTITSLYSGTTYEIAASATNSLGSTSEYFTPRAQFTTKLPELGDTIQTVNLSSYYSSVYSTAYNNGTQIINPIMFSGAQWPSSSLAINSILITTGPDITGAKVAAVVNDGTSDSNNSEITFTLSSGGTNTVTNGADGKVIIATNSTVSDPYSAGDSGFYWQSDFKAQIGNQSAGLTVQTLKFTQSFTGSPTVNTRNIQFLVDSLPINTAPVITDYQITDNSEKESISGVSICPGNWSLEVSNVQTQNVVRYFHAQKLLTYSFANSNFQNLLTTFQGVGTEANTFLTSGLTITPGQIDATYRYQPQITVFATNINKTNNTGQLSKTINIILDKPSKDLKNGFGVNQTPNGSTAGERIKTSTAVYSEPVIQAGRTDFIATYSQFRNTYDDTKAINTAIGTEGCNDLQLLGGRFITKSYTGIEGGYQNYGSGLDYSQISGTGFRWVGFRWKLQSGEMSNLVFSIQGLIGNAIASLQQDSTSPKILLGSSKELKFYYRIENQADSGGTGNPSDVENTQNAGGGISTVWVDANSSNEQSNFGKYMGVRSYAGILGGVQTRNKITITGTTTKSIEYNVTTPTFQLGSSANVYIYAVVGLPMDVDIAFTGVRCTATFSS